MSNQPDFLTLGDLRKALADLPDTPEFNQLPLIYSHDDEGNEYQAVNWLPSVVRIKEMKARFIERLDEDEREDEEGEESYEAVQALIIN